MYVEIMKKRESEFICKQFGFRRHQFTGNFKKYEVSMKVITFKCKANTLTLTDCNIHIDLKYEYVCQINNSLFYISIISLKGLFKILLLSCTKEENSIGFCQKENEILLHGICFQVFQMNFSIGIDEMEKICDLHNSTLVDLMASFSSLYVNVSTFSFYLSSEVNRNPILSYSMNSFLLLINFTFSNLFLFNFLRK